ncbi:MAG: hypothetical protein ACXVB9_20865 [Bdellovibrionota bacterium]
MTDFKPDCTINLHVEARTKPAVCAWVCSISHVKCGRVVLARKTLGDVPRPEAELEVLHYGLAQALRFQQEKIVVTATFPLGAWLGESKRSGGAGKPEFKAKREAVARAWATFRLKKINRMDAPDEKSLREEAENAFPRKRSQ